MKPCPRCGEKMGYGAKACKCGWKERTSTPAAGAPQSQHIQCAHMDCTQNAVIKEKTPTGWANLCYAHMMKRANERAKEFCLSIGVTTVGQAREWLRKNKLMVKRAPVLEREPGCDDE